MSLARQHTLAAILVAALCFTGVAPVEAQPSTPPAPSTHQGSAAPNSAAAPTTDATSAPTSAPASPPSDASSLSSLSSDAQSLSSSALHASGKLSSALSSQGSSAISDTSPENPLTQFMREMVEGSANTKASSDRMVAFFTTIIYALGLGHLLFPKPKIDPLTPPIFDTDPSISGLHVVKKEPEYDGRVERWFIASPAMQRVVEVQVMLQKDPTVAAPMLYLLDGVDAPHDNGWFHAGNLIDQLGDENVIGVLPTDAPASFYADWIADDPVLGHMKWETFLTEELPSLLEAPNNPTINFNGNRAIGGLSMGAAAAVRIAAKHPAIFDAAIGISGCYSTMDPVGRATHEGTVQSQNGTIDNMWGAYGSSEWQANDAVLNVAGLHNTAVYLSAADGYVDDAVREEGRTNPWQGLAIGITLEQGSYHCTKLLDAAMSSANMPAKKVVYLHGGSHQWINFSAQLKPGWDYIKAYL